MLTKTRAALVCVCFTLTAALPHPLPQVDSLEHEIADSQAGLAAQPAGGSKKYARSRGSLHQAPLHVVAASSRHLERDNPRETTALMMEETLSRESRPAG